MPSLLDDEAIIAQAAYCVGIVAVMMFLLGLIFYNEAEELAYFLIAMAGIIGCIAIGLHHHRKWGYYGLKAILYFLLPSFPIGTYIARHTLKSFEERNLKRFFR